MTDEQMAQMRAVLRSFRASDGEDDVLILTAGAELNNSTLTPRQTQLVEQTAASTKAIAQITGVPPEMLYELTEAKYNASIEQQGSFVVRFTFRPWITLAESELTLKLLTDAEQDAGYTIALNPDALLRGSTKEQMDVVATGRKAGIYTGNESREYLGLAKSDDPDADKLKTSGDTVPNTTTAAASNRVE
jgi:HK97 family phage portal protein